MIARKSSMASAGRATALATAAALVLSAVAPSAAMAAPRAGKAVSAASSDATDFSARRRAVVRRGHGGGAAAAAAFAGIVGTGLAIAATQNRRAYYDDYYGGPYPSGGYGPGYGYYYSPGW